MSSLVSFRDPGGFCFVHQGKFFRAVTPESLIPIVPFLKSDTAKALISQHDLVSTRQLEPREQEALLRSDEFRQLTNGYRIGAVFEHEKIDFASYPYEWAPEMLYAAGRLTLDLAQQCLREDYSLKDASPYNVFFRKGAPVFIDLLSFERRNPCDPIWNPYAQYCRNFLLPLLAHKTWGVPLSDIFTSRRDGIKPADIYRLCSPIQRLLRPFLTLVTLPTWLSRKKIRWTVYRDRLLKEREKARFILNSSFGRIRRILHRVQPNGSKSFWEHYSECHSYPEAAFNAKKEFLESCLREIQSRRVLDVGANTGHFSVCAAQAKADVVAIDSDAGCVGALWKKVESEKLNILPLVVDFSRPSAAQGWRNRECASFLDRAGGAFDAVIMFGILHHLLVSERIPLKEILEAAEGLTSRWLLIEFVPPQDEMFQILTRGRDSLHADLNESRFEGDCKETFEIVWKQRLPGMERCLYLLHKRV
jgi:2-polyprenyl-3-methyl-5-hydroxy-6-metoxy-1,4-benzoquinol methylase